MQAAIQHPGEVGHQVAMQYDCTIGLHASLPKIPIVAFVSKIIWAAYSGKCLTR